MQSTDSTTQEPRHRLITTMDRQVTAGTMTQAHHHHEHAGDSHLRLQGKPDNNEENLRCLHPILKHLGSSLSAAPDPRFLLTGTAGGKRRRLKYLGPCSTHGRPSLSSRALGFQLSQLWRVSQCMRDSSLSNKFKSFK